MLAGRSLATGALATQAFTTRASAMIPTLRTA